MVRFNVLAPGRVPRRLLFVGEAVSLAHVARPAVLARWAREAGHEVHFACGSRYAGVPRSEGLEPIAVETIDAGDFYARLAKGKFFYTAEELGRYVRAEVELITRVKPDLVVGDFRLTLPVSAELCGVECLSLANAHWNPAADRNLPAPEGGLFGMLPRGLREKLFAAIRPMAYRYFAAPLDRVRRSFGLPAFKDFRQHYTAGDACAYLDLPELYEGRRMKDEGRKSSRSGIHHLPSGHFFLGPVDWSPSNAPEPLLDDLGSARPLAYVSMGSSGDGRRLPEILRALLAAGCDLAVSGVKETAAAELLRAIPELADRAYMAEFFNPRAALSDAKLTVCHGGSGTVYQSLSAGVPVLCCPANPDQRLVSEAVAAAGTGEIVNWANLRAQVGGILAGTCRAGARRLALAMAGHETRAKWLAFLEGGRTMQRRHTLTQHLRVLEERVATEPVVEADRFAFGDGRYTIRVANDLESRRKAYQLVYRLYLEKEYAKPHPSKMWIGAFDALPETVTLLVERQFRVASSKFRVTSEPGTRNPEPGTESVPVGALTVVFDSPWGLPADRLYKGELDALRASGRRIAEVVSLGVAEEAGAGAQVLVKLFNFAYFVARGIRGATDFVNTVNPRHVRFYERLMLFSPAGPERDYDKVGGAPAVLLRLDFDVAERQRVPGSGFLVPGSTGNQERGTRNCRSIYDQFRAVAEEPDIVAALKGRIRPMTDGERQYFFAAEADCLAAAAPQGRSRIGDGWVRP